MLNLTDGRGFFTNKSILAIYLQQAQTSGEVFKNYPFINVAVRESNIDSQTDKITET